MRLRPFKFISCLVLLTLVALLYVHQHVELVKLSYAINTNERSLEDVLDRKEKLEYNIKMLEAPLRLEKILVSRKIDVTFPKKGQVVRVARLSPGAKVEGKQLIGPEKKVNLFGFGLFRFFGLSQEAQAKER